MKHGCLLRDSGLVRVLVMLAAIAAAHCAHAPEPVPNYTDTYGLNEPGGAYTSDFVQAISMLTGVGAQRDAKRGTELLRHLCLMRDINACNYAWLTNWPRFHFGKPESADKALRANADLFAKCDPGTAGTVRIEFAYDEHGHVFIARDTKHEGVDRNVATCVRDGVYATQFHDSGDEQGFVRASFEMAFCAASDLSCRKAVALQF
jgi:hypothetical protein